MAESKNKHKGALSYFRRDRGRSNMLRMWVPAIAVTLLGFVVAYFFVEPAPPDSIVFVAGPADGAYFDYARQYANELGEEGIEVIVKESPGSVQNVKTLGDPQSDAVIGFVQGGTAGDPPANGLTALGSMYLEPLWVFYRSGTGQVDEFAKLTGRRVAIGREGSGTRPLALRLLEAADAKPTETVDAGGAEAANMLMKGDLDAAMFVVGPGVDYVAELLAHPEVEILDLRRATAFSRLFPYLKTVLLAEGVVDPARNLPGRDVRLLAPSASLVVNEDMHPALVPLFLEAAKKIHGGGDRLSGPGDFPSQNYIELPLNKQARRYFNHGPPFLTRYLPFWAASLLDRLKVMLLPMLTLLFPLFRVAPPVIRWRIRNKIYRWYTALRAVDEKLQEGVSQDELDTYIKQLGAIEGELADVDVPLSYMEEFYNLRLHLDFITRKLKAMREEQNGESEDGE